MKQFRPSNFYSYLLSLFFVQPIFSALVCSNIFFFIFILSRFSSVLSSVRYISYDRWVYNFHTNYLIHRYWLAFQEKKLHKKCKRILFSKIFLLSQILEISCISPNISMSKMYSKYFLMNITRLTKGREFKYKLNFIGNLADCLFLFYFFKIFFSGQNVIQNLDLILLYMYGLGSCVRGWNILLNFFFIRYIHILYQLSIGLVQYLYQKYFKMPRICILTIYLSCGMFFLLKKICLVIFQFIIDPHHISTLNLRILK